MYAADRQGQIHIIGAGLSGLAAAVRLLDRDAALAGRLRLYEGANHAGGRCRTFFDSTLGCEIDNGNHLMMAANTAVLAYAASIGSAASLVGPAESAFPFVDLETLTRWTIRPNAGRFPWWIFSASRRIPGSRATDYLSGLALMRAGRSDTVADAIRDRGTVWRALWEPLAIGVLNAQPDEGSARLLARVFAETFGKGGTACRPLVAATGLSHSLVDPALRRLETAGVPIRYGARLREIKRDDTGRITSLRFHDGDVALSQADRIILALPAHVADTLLPELSIPAETRSIANVHFRLPDRPVVDDRAGMPVPVIGLVGSTAQWLFLRDDVASVTISAADHLSEMTSDILAQRIWREVAQALTLLSPANRAILDRITTSDRLPPVRVVKEKRATFLQTPEAVRRRPATGAAGPGLALAGDWTDTGLPATIEGSIRSGFSAADHLLMDGRSG